MELWIEGTIDEVVAAVDTGLVNAVATNPTIIARWTASGQTMAQVVTDVCRRVEVPVYVQLHGPSVDGYMAEMEALSKISGQISPKLVATQQGMIAAHRLAQQGAVKPLITAVATVNQAFLAARAGAAYIAPYFGRIEDAGRDAAGLVSQVAALYARHGIETRIAAASIRTPAQATAALLAGADVAVMGYDVFVRLLEDELTQNWIDRFEADWAKFI